MSINIIVISEIYILVYAAKYFFQFAIKHIAGLYSVVLALSSNGLGPSPFKAGIGVRISAGSFAGWCGSGGNASLPHRASVARHAISRWGLQGVAQLGRASGLGPEGRRFESYHPDW